MSVLAVSNLSWPVEKLVNATIAFDSSYPTAGETINASAFGLAAFTRVIVRPTGAAAGGAGYTFNPLVSSDGTTALIEVYVSAGFTPAGTNGTSSVTAETFTGTAPAGVMNLATPAFSGTGYATSGQVITTTDNQTMAATTTAAGMWFVPVSGSKPPVLILSNTIVSGAPAVLTVQGIAPTTDAGTYTIVRGVTPAGTNSTATASAQTFTGTAVAAGVLTEVGSGVSLAALTAVPISVYGY